MFAHVRGTLISIEANNAVIDVNGIGFKVGMSSIALSSLGPVGSTVTIYTSLIVRSEALDLYGFQDSQERGLFERLISVSGVGPKVALSALSSFNSASLQQLIIDEDVKRLTTIPGLGTKTAQRLILELKGSLVATDQGIGQDGQANKTAVSAQVTEALLGMGFTKQEVELASKDYQGSADNVTEHIRFILQRLGGG
ncbi:MAG: Holliday junction branch migration protein RuvA [Coriobacteriia bacterium]|nr:Holliday junction branch migration protein RuvA [Coriobacteriia bacterium]